MLPLVFKLLHLRSIVIITTVLLVSCLPSIYHCYDICLNRQNFDLSQVAMIVALSRTELLILQHDKTYYSVSTAALDGAGTRLYLRDAQPLNAFKSRYVNLFRSKQYLNMKPYGLGHSVGMYRRVGGDTIVQSILFLAAARSDESQFDTITFDLDRDLVYGQSFRANPAESVNANRTVWISAWTPRPDEPKKFLALLPPSGDAATSGYLIADIEIHGAEQTMRATNLRRICTLDNCSRVRIDRQLVDCAERQRWTSSTRIELALIHRGYFFLFADNYVWIFESDVFERTVSLLAVKYSDFLDCDNYPPPTSAPNTGPTNTGTTDNGAQTTESSSSSSASSSIASPYSSFSPPIDHNTTTNPNNTECISRQMIIITAIYSANWITISIIILILSIALLLFLYPLIRSSSSFGESIIRLVPPLSPSLPELHKMAANDQPNQRNTATTTPTTTANITNNNDNNSNNNNNNNLKIPPKTMHKTMIRVASIKASKIQQQQRPPKNVCGSSGGGNSIGKSKSKSKKRFKTKLNKHIAVSSGTIPAAPGTLNTSSRGAIITTDKRKTARSGGPTKIGGHISRSSKTRRKISTAIKTSAVASSSSSSSTVVTKQASNKNTTTTTSSPSSMMMRSKRQKVINNQDKSNSSGSSIGNKSDRGTSSNQQHNSSNSSEIIKTKTKNLLPTSRSDK